MYIRKYRVIFYCPGLFKLQFRLLLVIHVSAAFFAFLQVHCAIYFLQHYHHLPDFHARLAENGWSDSRAGKPLVHKTICAEVEEADGVFENYKAKLESSCRFEQILIWIQAYGNMVTVTLQKDTKNLTYGFRRQ